MPTDPAPSRPPTRSERIAERRLASANILAVPKIEFTPSRNLPDVERDHIVEELRRRDIEVVVTPPDPPGKP